MPTRPHALNDLSVKALIAAVPRDCLLPSTTRSLLTLARDLLLFTAIAAAIVFVHRHLRPDAAWTRRTTTYVLSITPRP